MYVPIAFGATFTPITYGYGYDSYGASSQVQSVEQEIQKVDQRIASLKRSIPNLKRYNLLKARKAAAELARLHVLRRRLVAQGALLSKKSSGKTATGGSKKSSGKTATGGSKKYSSSPVPGTTTAPVGLSAPKAANFFQMRGTPSGPSGAEVDVTPEFEAAAAEDLLASEPWYATTTAKVAGVLVLLGVGAAVYKRKGRR